MCIAVRFPDATDPSNKEVYHPIAGETINAFLTREFRHNFDGIETDIFVNGDRILSTASGDMSGLDRVINPNDRIAIVHMPSGIDPFTIAVAVIAIVAAVAVMLLMPEIPGNADNQGSSPNSKLNAATNEFRPGEAIPEVFGSPRCYPDFVQPSWYEYENNIKVQRELFCITAGQCVVNDVFSGETRIDDIPQSLWEKYEPAKWDGQFPPSPGTLPPLEKRLTVRETNEITNQSLEGANTKAFEKDVSSVGADTINTTDGKYTFTEADWVFVTDTNLQVGDYLKINLSIQTGGGGVTLIDGTFLVASIDNTLREIVLTGAAPLQSSSNGAGMVTKVNSSGEVDNWVGWYTASGRDNEQVWFHIAMPSGIRNDGGGWHSVEYEIQIRQVDITGAPIPGTEQSQTHTIEGATLDPQFRTHKFTNLPAGRYQGRAKRITDEFNNYVEKIVFEQLVGVEFQRSPNYGDITLLWVERRADERIVSGRESKINVDMIRKLPYYNRTTGQLEPDNLVATRDFADAAAYTLVVAANRPISTVDLAELYAINDRLPVDLRSFDFTFDDHNVGLRERVTVICNVARVIAYQSYQRWAFTRAEAKAAASMVFTRRNTTGSARQSFPQWLPSSKDSIALSYVELPDNVEKIIYRRISNGQILDDGPGLYPDELTLSGCQSAAQAENRADYEIRRLLYQRNTVEFEALYFGLEAEIGERVRWADINDMKVFDGEILYIDTGNEYLTSEEITFEAGKTYYVQITQSDGSVSAAVQCHPLNYTKQGFTAPGLQAYIADADFALGSQYVIAADDEAIGTDYLIKSIVSSSENTVTVTLSQYDVKMFEAD